MRKIIYLIIFFATMFSVTSCFKEDERMPASELQTSTIEMNQYYQYQAYFDLVKGEVVAQNDKNDWDLGFECADSAWHIILNTSEFMVAGNTGMKDLSVVSDTTGLKWKFDKSDGNPDSTAIGKWLIINGADTTYTNDVYVINRGYDHLGNLRGLKKIIFMKADFSGFTFKYSDMNGNNPTEFRITKREGLNYTQFSFENGGQQVDFEPMSDSWNLFFTQYTTLLFTNEGDPYPYLVTGVLLNYGKEEVAVDTVQNFENIDLSYASSLTYSKAEDAIGYDWKALKGDVNSGNVYYEIVKGRTYLIRDESGIYFKLRFVSFYNNVGDKGYPSFEYLLL